MGSLYLIVLVGSLVAVLAACLEAINRASTKAPWELRHGADPLSLPAGAAAGAPAPHRGLAMREGDFFERA